MDTDLVKINNDFQININSSISFAPFVRFLKNRSSKLSLVKNLIYKAIIEKFEARPELLQPFKDLDVIEKNMDLIQMLDTVATSLISEESYVAFSFPYDSRLFHTPENFSRKFIMNADGVPAHQENKQSMEKDHTIYLYKTIIRKFYKLDISFPDEMVFIYADPISGLKKNYRIHLDNRFADITYIGNRLPDITSFINCDGKNNIPDINSVKTILPLEDFVFEGFSIIQIEDFTEKESINEMKNVILTLSSLTLSECYSTIKNILQTLLEIKLLTINLFPFIKVNDDYIKTKEYHLGNDSEQDPYSFGNTFYDFDSGLKNYLQNPEIILLQAMDQAAIDNYPTLSALYDSDVAGYLLHPVYYQNKLVGVIELTSDQTEAFDTHTIAKLENFIPLLAQVFNFQIEKFVDEIEKVIKEQFTAIQPSVEWKFNEVIWEYFKNRNLDKNQIGNVIFKDVYPLYGAVDIRNSSIERNIAIRKDLLEQLTITGKAIKDIQSVIDLPLLEGLHFRNENLLNNTEKRLSPDDEIALDTYFDEEVLPLFNHLYESNDGAKVILDNYYNSVTTLRGHVYHYQKEYEESLNKINNVVNHYLSVEKDKIQLVYPNYFEKYKTDGVEYNIYIGQSIAPNKPFNPVYLKNLHLWQLTSMVELAKLTHDLLPELEVPLQTTQLILVHNTPIDISFRKDEKRFDTEGAYNLRYEIMKKRIDKSHVKNTNERLTQPDKIAIVYSNAKDAEEYLSYIVFLQNKNRLISEIEYLELEELQGVYGLKALRVGIKYDELL